MKNRTTLKIGDTFELHPNTTLNLRATSWDKASPNINHDLLGGTKEIFNIKENIVTFEWVGYRGSAYFQTTFEELERVGILDKVEEIKVGDTVVCISLEGFPEDSQSHVVGQGIKIGDELIVSSVGKNSFYAAMYLKFEGKSKIHPQPSFKLKTTMKIIGYKAPTDLFRGEVKKDDIYIVNGCNDKMFVPQTPRANTAAYYSVPTEIAETWLPVYEEEFKVGDYVVLTKHPTGWASEQPLGTVLKIENDKTKYCGGMMFTVSKNGKRMGGLDDGCYRQATQEEILATQTTTVTVSNHNIELTIYKNGAITSKKQPFSIIEVKDLYNSIYDAFNHAQIGPWNVYLENKDARFIRVGCTEENFKVSINELKTVIDAYDSLQ